MKFGGRLLRLLFGLAGTAVLLAVLLAGGLAWRLTRGPLDVTGPARALAASAWPGLTVDRVTLALDGPALRIAIADAADAGIALRTADIALAAAPLLHGAIRPLEIAASALRLRVTRQPDGSVTIDGLPSGGEGPTDTAIFARLGHVALQDVSLTLTDVETGQSATLNEARLDLRREAGGGVTGHAGGVFAAGSISTELRLEATQSADGGDTRLHATADALNPAALARLLPAAAPLAALDATLALAADVTLGPAFSLRHAWVHAASGPGVALLPAKGGTTSPAPFTSLTLDADGDARAATLTALRVVLAPPSGSPPSTVLLSGDASRAANPALAHLHIALDRAQLADLGSLWPVGVGGGARTWLVGNVPAGAVHDGQFDLTFQAPGTLEDAELTAAGGSMLADGVVLYWLRPVPPVERARAVLTVLDPDTLTVSATGGHLGALVAQQASIRITGLSTRHQFGLIEADIAAPIADVFTLLQHKRLKLLSVHPLPIGTPTGQSQTHLTVKLPLEDKVDFDSIAIHAAAKLTDVRISPVAAGRTLDQGALALDVTQDGLTVSGPARLATIPATVNVAMDFRAGPPEQVVQRVRVAARADDAALAAAGLDTIGLVAGTVSATAEYAEQRSGRATLQASADLTQAALSTPVGWSKPAGAAASVEARAELDHGVLAGFDNLRADGPGLSVRGRSEMIDGRPSVLHVDRGVIGRTSVTGTVTFPRRAGDALQVVLAGPMLDLSGPLNRKTTFEPSTPASVAPGRPYRVDLRFDRVQLGTKGEGIGPVTLMASGDERRIAQARLVSAGAEHLAASIVPRGEGRHASVRLDDFGLLLRSIGSGVRVEKGAFALDGDFDDRKPGSPLTGTATLTGFGVHGVTLLGKVLQGMTLYGLVDALSGPGLSFDRLATEFTLLGPVLDLREARAYSASLGVTAQGQVDFGRNVLNVQGTIVPAYFFNTLPGRMPLIGRLFSPEPGGGLFAATFSVHGPMADPSVGVNPLATLTPGALRGLFGVFD